MNLNTVEKILQYGFKRNAVLYEQGKQRLTYNLVGGAGIGKTAIAIQALTRDLKDQKVRVVKVNPAQFIDPGDISGTPQTDYLVWNKDRTKQVWMNERSIVDLDVDSYVYDENNRQIRQMSYAQPDWWPRDKNEQVALILDDNWRSNQSVQQALMELVYDYTYMGQKVPKNVIIITTNNPDSEDYNVQSLDPAQLRRTVNIDVEFNMDTYLQHEANNLNNLLLLFISQNKEAMLRTENGKTIYEMPANITRFSEFIGQGNPLENKEISGFDLLSCGPMFFGKNSTFVVQFDTFLKGNKHQIPLAEEFYTKPTSEIKKMLAPLKDNLSVMGICARRVAQYVIDNYENYADLEKRLMFYMEDTEIFYSDKKFLIFNILTRTNKIPLSIFMKNPIFKDYLANLAEQTS